MGVDEEEAWLNEKTTLVSSEEAGDTLAAVQVGGVVWVMEVGGVYSIGVIYLVTICKSACIKSCHVTVM